MILSSLILFGQIAVAPDVASITDGESWLRHTIDASSEGADGVRALDINGDNLPDIATAWEEGASIRLYLNPGTAKARELWPKAVVASVAAPEDAVFADLDGDGAVDMVSCSEGKERRIWFHWAPNAKADLLQEALWETVALPAAENQRQWMYALPADVDGDGRIDVIAGAKGPDAAIGWFQAPSDPRRLEDWTWHAIREAGWIMSLILEDMNGDGFQDIVYSDRRGPNRGVGWLENPGPGKVPAGEGWADHTMGGQEHEVMFLCAESNPEKSANTWWCTTRDGPILRFHRQGGSWIQTKWPMPSSTGTGKGIATGDIDGDGIGDLVISCENAEDKVGVFWLKGQSDDGPTIDLPVDGGALRSISGTTGTKFDLVYLCDFDGDGDLDVATCEEREGLGLFWYENPSPPRP